MLEVVLSFKRNIFYIYFILVKKKLNSKNQINETKKNLFFQQGIHAALNLSSATDTSQTTPSGIPKIFLLFYIKKKIEILFFILFL